MDDRKRMSSSAGAPCRISALALMLLILVPGPTTAEETSVFDRITSFFSDRFSSSASEVPKARSLEACTALSEDAHKLMTQRQEGEARSAATKRALEMAGKAAWPSNVQIDAKSAYMQLVGQAYAADRSWFFFLRGRIADEFRDNTFAECLSDFQ
jgi:hypothetical protein